MKLLIFAALVVTASGAFTCEADSSAVVSWETCSCVSNCATCTNDDECTTCEDGYYLDTDLTCTVCPGTGAAACATCDKASVDGATTSCLTCAATHVLQAADGVCVALGVGVKTGTAASDAITITACRDGYYDNSAADADMTCTICPGTGAATCATCDKASVDGATTSCLTCAATHVLQAADGVCVALGTGVKTGTAASDAITPTACMDGYYDNSAADADMTCTICPGTGAAACATCDKASVDGATTSCLTCAATHAKSATTGACIALPAAGGTFFSYCAAGTATGTTATCTACFEGFVEKTTCDDGEYMSTAGDVSTCTTCPGTGAAACATCDKASVDGATTSCLTCAATHVLQAADGVCVALGVGVKTGTAASDAITITACMDGYYDNSAADADMTCTICPGACATCDKASVDGATTSCLTCPATTTIQTDVYAKSDDGTCQVMPAWCGTGTFAGATLTCTACGDRYTKQAATSTTFTASTCKEDECWYGDKICGGTEDDDYSGYSLLCPPEPTSSGTGTAGGTGTGPDAGDEAAAGTVQASAMLIAVAMAIVAALQ